MSTRRPDGTVEPIERDVQGARRVLIQGAGAVGRLFAASLRSAGCDVTLLDRDQRRRDLIAGSGLVWVDSAATSHTLSVPVLLVGDIPQQEFALLVCCVKAWAVEGALAEAERFLARDALVLVVSNGLGNLELAESRWDPDRCLVGTSTYGAMRIGQNGVASRGEGVLTIGCRSSAGVASSELAALVRELGRGLEVVAASDVLESIWRKAAVNCGINPVASVLGLRNGELLKSPGYRLSETIVREVALVARAEGISLADELALGDLRAVCEATPNNRCSMLVDLEMGRQTEISALCEEVVRRARQHRLSVPANELVAILIRAREHVCSSG